MPSVHIVQLPMFNMSVVWVCDCDPQEAVDAFYDYEGKRSLLVPRESDGWVQQWAGDVFMYVRSSDNANVVYHELVHVAFTVCEIKGITPDEELLAYMVGHLHDEIAAVMFTEYLEV